MTEITIELQDRVLMLGEGGGGKTYAARAFLKRFSKSKVLIITPNAEEFTDYKNRVVTFETEEACEAIGEALEKGNVMIVIDDSDVILDKIMTDRRFKVLANSGRHYGCGWTVMSRRTADIPTILAKQAKKLFLFQTDLPRDVQFLNEFYYPAGDEVKDLDRDSHEFLYIDRDAKTRTRMTA